tara:strand:- start:385 stop:645 length:261 start_codon:yes stop_codon:yes gene_type:complete
MISLAIVVRRLDIRIHLSKYRGGVLVKCSDTSMISPVIIMEFASRREFIPTGRTIVGGWTTGISLPRTNSIIVLNNLEVLRAFVLD